MEIYQGPIVYQVWEAVDSEGRLPVGEKVTLENITDDQDGIFPNEKSWRQFLYGNFGTGDGAYYLEGKPSKHLLKKYCYKPAEYNNLFVQHVGGGRYVIVEPEMLDFEFSYDANNFRKGSNVSCTVEIFVKATLKT